MMRGVQNPAWQRPMHAPVRCFTPSSERAPGTRRQASRICASLTRQQRHTMVPYAGSHSIRRSHSAWLMRLRSGMGRRRGSNAWLRGRPSMSFACAATMRPIAGLAVRPGLSMPVQSRNPGAPATGPMMNSCPGWCARRPENEVMVSRNGMSFTVRALLRRTA